MSTYQNSIRTAPRNGGGRSLLRALAAPVRYLGRGISTIWAGYVRNLENLRGLPPSL